MERSDVQRGEVVLLPPASFLHPLYFFSSQAYSGVGARHRTMGMVILLIHVVLNRTDSVLHGAGAHPDEL